MGEEYRERIVTEIYKDIETTQYSFNEGNIPWTQSDVNFVMDLSGWNVSNVTDMSHMFFDVGGYDQAVFDIGDITGWNVSNVLDMTSMFASIKAERDYRLDLSRWIVNENVVHDDFNLGVEELITEPDWPTT